jgi:hypothetical protein
MAEGDIDSVLTVYDGDAVFLNQGGELRKDREAIRQELTAARLPSASTCVLIGRLADANDPSTASADVGSIEALMAHLRCPVIPGGHVREAFEGR